MCVVDYSDTVMKFDSLKSLLVDNTRWSRSSVVMDFRRIQSKLLGDYEVEMIFFRSLPSLCM